MRFTKMHGIGNDYVYVNCFDVPFPKDPAELARRMADRQKQRSDKHLRQPARFSGIEPRSEVS